MRRDKTLIRKILEYVETVEDGDAIIFVQPGHLDGQYTQDEIDFHVGLCARSGLLDLYNSGVYIRSLSMSGYDYLEQLRDKDL